jgi:uncharacterized lipoprotein YmbA
MVWMSRLIKILKLFLMAIMVILLSSCAATNKNSYVKKRKKASIVNTSQLGKNKYYFSSGYQKKLSRSFKRR